MKVLDVYNAVNEISPFENGCVWDNGGLICGSMSDGVTGIAVTLDADRFALEFAIKNGCNTVVSHHPLIWDALKKVTDTELVYHYIRNGISVISAHTCLDAATGGINDILADMLCMQDRKTIDIDGVPLGRYGKVCENAVDVLASKLNARADSVIVRPISVAGVISGAGGSELEYVAALGCDTLITGEAKHDRFVAAENMGINLISLGHYETETVILKPLADKLKEKLADVKVLVSDRKPLITRR